MVHDAEGSDASGQLAAQEDVLVDAQVPGQRQVLVDHLDAERAGVGRAAEADGLAFDEDLAGARRMEAGEALHERRLAGAVVAHDAEYLAGLESCRLTSLSATTCPKCFEMPRASMIGVSAATGDAREPARLAGAEVTP